MSSWATVKLSRMLSFMQTVRQILAHVFASHTIHHILSYFTHNFSLNILCYIFTKDHTTLFLCCTDMSVSPDDDHETVEASME
jgi:hypothetical protein